MSVCYPYGRAIACVCNSHDKVVNCFPTLEMEKKREVVGRQGSMAMNMARDMKDNHTEILLAATALVATIALFLSFLIYRVEKYLESHKYEEHFNTGRNQLKSQATQTDQEEADRLVFSPRIHKLCS